MEDLRNFETVSKLIDDFIEIETFSGKLRSAVAQGNAEQALSLAEPQFLSEHGDLKWELMLRHLIEISSQGHVDEALATARRYFADSEEMKARGIEQKAERVEAALSLLLVNGNEEGSAGERQAEASSKKKKKKKTVKTVEGKSDISEKDSEQEQMKKKKAQPTTTTTTSSSTSAAASGNNSSGVKDATMLPESSMMESSLHSFDRELARMVNRAMLLDAGKPPSSLICTLLAIQDQRKKKKQKFA